MNWINENKVLIFGLLLVICFIGLAVSQNKQPDDKAKLPLYQQVDSSSKMKKGEDNAPVSVIQYSDFICPSCSYFSTQIMPTIEEKYIKTGKIKFEFRPMAFIADGSTQAGMGAYCAIDQDKFWEYHDSTYKIVADKVYNQGLDPKHGDVILTALDVKNIAKDTGLENVSFNECLDSKQHEADINKSTNTANTNGITGTPYIMIDGQVYQGDMSLASIEALIKAKL